MSPRLKLKHPGQEYRLIRQRVLFAGLVMFLLALTLLVRVFFLQVVMHDHFTTLSRNNRVKIVPISPIRGLVFSRDGVLLADNRPSFSLELIPERIDNLDKTIAELSELVPISDFDVARFHEQLRKKRRFENVPLRFNLNEVEVAKVAIERHRFPGVDIVARLDRFYPLGATVAHAVGYVGMIDEQELEQLDRSNYSATTHIGKLGVEKAYEDMLHGRVGYQQVEVNAQGRVIRVLDRTPPRPGRNIYLTLDISLQNAATEALAGRRGAIVAIDPNDGGILAMVSSPAYDPNLFVNGIDRKSYQELLSSKDVPLLNRVLQGKYPPGSTIKPFLALGALDYGVRSLSDVTWCPGWFTLKGSSHQYRDWKKGGHGYLDLTQAVAQSCDVYFYSLAQDLGIDRLHDALDRFGFGHKTGIDIGGETAGLIPSREWKQRAYRQPWYPGETLILGIGQGYMLATPVQMALATALIANHGKYVTPHLLAEARNVLTGETVQTYRNPNAGRRWEIPDSHWDEVVHAMREVIHGPRGTARRSGLGASYEFGGKTGTAQVIGIAQDESYKAEDVPEEFRDHALFIAFAPVVSPRIALAIVVENGGGGSATAAPIARALFDRYLNPASAPEPGQG